MYLVRISFDGYGCCNTDDNATKLSLPESQALLELVEADDVNRNEVREILYRYFNQNRNVIWRDALEDHELLKWRWLGGVRGQSDGAGTRSSLPM